MRSDQSSNSKCRESASSLEAIRREKDRLLFVLRFLSLEIGEDSASDEQLLYLSELVHRQNIRTVAEIGFNAGITSHTLLKAKPDLTIVSFDIHHHNYVQPAKKFIDRHCPGRHALVYGDSKQTVLAYKEANPSARFDLVFIDGGHDYETARADIENCKRLCDAKSMVIMDDLTPWHSWGEGPTKAWAEAIESGLVVQRELVKDGEPVTEIAPPGIRLWALGEYTFGAIGDQ